MLNSCHQLCRTLTHSFGNSAFIEGAMIQKKPEKVEIIRIQVLSEEKVVSQTRVEVFNQRTSSLGWISLLILLLSSLVGIALKVAGRVDSIFANKH